MSIPTLGEAVSGGGSGTIPSADADITSDDLSNLLARKFQELITPYYERQVELDKGDPLKAISMKPSGFWYRTEYVRALIGLGSTPIPIREGEMKPANEFYRDLLNKGYFRTFISGPEEFWERIPDYLNPDMMTLQMQSHVKASQAYESLGNKLTFIDCEAMRSLAIALTLKEVLGDEKFDITARALQGILEKIKTKKDTLNPELLRSALGGGALFSLLFPDLTLSKGSEICLSSLDELPEGLRIGDMCYLESHRDALIRFADLGFHLIYLGDGKFTGFGLNPEGVTLREVAENLFQNYDKDPSILIELISATDTSFKVDDLSYSIFDLRKLAAGTKRGIKPKTFFEKRLPEWEKEVTRQIANMVSDARSKELSREQFMKETVFFRPGLPVFQLDASLVNRLIHSTPQEIKELVYRRFHYFK